MQNNTYSSSNKRIAKNTLFLYFRQILIMIVNLYLARLVLNILGVIDFGIHNVVAGMVLMFSFLSSSMASASQRFFSFNIGQRKTYSLNKIFNIALLIYLLISIIVLVLLETIGSWFLHNKLVIPPDRMNAAILVYQFSVLSFICIILQTPFLSLIISHEDMSLYATVGIVEVFLRLGLIMLIHVISLDKLILYSILLASVTFITTFIYIIFCRFRYDECRIKFLWDRDLFLSMVSFSSWSLLGNLSVVLKTQGINILLNIYFGPVANAASGIANRVNSAVTSFSQNFGTAVRPQIIKLYAANEWNELILLTFRSSKYTSILIIIFFLPLVLEMPIVIKLWLGQAPEHVVAFTRLILLDSLLKALTDPFKTVIQATGKIKNYQMIVGGISLMNIPLSMAIIRIGGGPSSVYFIGILLIIITSFFRIKIVQRQVSFDVLDLINKVFRPLALIIMISLGFSLISIKIFSPSLLRLTITTLISTFSMILSVYALGLSKDEKRYFKNIIRSLKKN